MKREYVGMICLLSTVIILIGGSYIIEQTKINEFVNKFIIVWLFIAYLIGQYSMKFPKKF